MNFAAFVDPAAVQIHAPIRFSPVTDPPTWCGFIHQPSRVADPGDMVRCMSTR